MRAEEFLGVIRSEGLEAVQTYTEEDLGDIDEPRLAAAALGAFWALSHLANLVEDLGPTEAEEESE